MHAKYAYPLKKFLSLGAIILFFSFMHPFYLSVTDLQYNAKEKALQGSVKIFVNDLEAALKKKHHKTIDLVNVKDSVYTRQVLQDYVSDNFNLKLNERPRTFTIIGFEREEEAIWIYVEFVKCEAPKKISITNTILFDHLKDQTNIVQVEVNGEKKSAKATNPDKNFSFNF